MTRMGFEGKIYHGAAGAEATTEITNSRDISYDFDFDQGDTTVRGNGSDIPVETSRVTVRKVSITWQMTNKEGDTSLAALLAAAYAGDPIAIRTKDKAAGKGYDGDCILKVKQAKPLKGEQTFEFTASPNDDERTPQLYV